MKKLYTVNDAIYTINPEKIEVEKVETLSEHIDQVSVTPSELELKVLVNEVKLNEDCNDMKVILNKEEFKSLFGPNVKPRKGDYLSLMNTQKKFKVKKSKKFTAKKSGKGYKLTLKKIE